MDTPFDKVSMDSTDTLSKGYPCLDHTMYVQGWAEYPWNLQILCQRGYPCLDHTMYIQGWSEYPWNLQILCQRGIYVFVYPRLVRVPMESTDTLSKGVSMS